MAKLPILGLFETADNAADAGDRAQGGRRLADGLRLSNRRAISGGRLRGAA